MPRVLVILVSLVVAGCGANSGETEMQPEQRAPAPATATAAKEPAAKPAARRAKVIVRESRYGPVLFDGKGRALYVFTLERSSKPRCYGECAAAWPPFTTRGEPGAGQGTYPSLLGTTKRRGGATQVTYRGRPLYYYVTDRAPGQITCHDIVEYGGTWLVIHPSGRAAD